MITRLSHYTFTHVSTVNYLLNARFFANCYTIAKVFPRITQRSCNRETFPPRTICIIRYIRLDYYRFKDCTKGPMPALGIPQKQIHTLQNVIVGLRGWSSISIRPLYLLISCISSTLAFVFAISSIARIQFLLSACGCFISLL